jgi:hypothetical protein
VHVLSDHRLVFEHGRHSAIPESRRQLQRSQRAFITIVDSPRLHHSNNKTFAIKYLAKLLCGIIIQCGCSSVCSAIMGQEQTN